MSENSQFEKIEKLLSKIKINDSNKEIIGNIENGIKKR